MAKRIVFCCDGTWQTPRNGTNVYRLYKALLQTADQIAFYDDGVGADGSRFDKLVGGMIGTGLLQKITDNYTKIAHVYEAGDELFLFGFSRGAYTARSLAGMIATCGLPTAQFDDGCVKSVFEAYRNPARRKEILGALVGCVLEDATIRMIGVWDTVGALGIPALFGKLDPGHFGFLDTALHPDVKNAFQALAIDEHRVQFPATLWTTAPAPGQTLEQVWFTGCHGDVGGGTAMAGGVDDATRLCDIPLGWMMTKAEGLGLTFDPAVAAAMRELPARYALDAYVDSWSRLPSQPPRPRPIPADACLANSVSIRVQYALTYMPPNLKMEEGALADSYTMVDLVDETAI